jgi:hypothetical protein
VEIESGSALNMTDSSSADLLAEINDKHKKWRVLPIVFVGAGVLLLVGINMGVPNWFFVGLAAATVLAGVLAWRRDVLAKSVVLGYELDPDVEKTFTRLHEAFKLVQQCGKVWHIGAKGRVRDRKYHAGASSLVDRKPTIITNNAPPFLKTNISTIAVPVGRQTLYLFPDRILVYDTNGVGAVAYRDLNVEVTQQRFIESESIPKDARVVDHTWQYVNRNGGPDRRFKSNRQLPICLYEEVNFTSGAGLNEVLQISRTGVGDQLRIAIQESGAI